MDFKLKSDYISWFILIGIVVLVLEVAFFNSGIIFSLLAACFLIYYGKKRMHKSSGKMTFWFGIALLVLNIFSMMTFKFLMIAVIIHFIIRFAESKKEPVKISPVLKEPEGFVEKKKKNVVMKNPVLGNLLIGEQKTPNDVYEWNDINIQRGIGDTTIDLSYTVLPQGETVIFIRGFIGNLQVLIPYDVEVEISHSAVIGRSKIFHIEEDKLWNQSVHYQTEEYDQAAQKVKIFTSVILGDLEVKWA